MSEFGFRPVFSEEATEFILQLPRRRQRKVVALAHQLAAHPYVKSDYSIPDESGRTVEHLMIEDFVFAYWLDDRVRELRVTDIDDAS